MSKGYDKTKGYVQQVRQSVANSRTPKPKPTPTPSIVDRGGKVRAGGKPMIQRTKSELKPTLDRQDVKPVTTVKDKSPKNTPKVVRGNGARVVSKPIKYPRRVKKIRER